MSDEPTNEQLANFLVVYTKRIPQLQGVNLDAGVLERQLKDPTFRESALKHHRNYQEGISELHKQMEACELQCDYIRPNGKRCPNRNTPSSFYCGLHQNEALYPLNKES